MASETSPPPREVLYTPLHSRIFINDAVHHKAKLYLLRIHHQTCVRNLKHDLSPSRVLIIRLDLRRGLILRLELRIRPGFDLNRVLIFGHW